MSNSEHGCAHCQHWEKEAEGSDATITKLICPICDRPIIALERTARLVNGMGADHWASDRNARQAAVKSE